MAVATSHDPNSIAPHIFSARDGLEMRRIDTVLDETEMIDFVAVWYRPYEQLIGDTMREPMTGKM
jgi:hypothetical protein